MSDDELDSHIAGLENTETRITGTFDPANAGWPDPNWPPLEGSSLTIAHESRRFLGIDWWNSYLHFPNVALRTYRKVTYGPDKTVSVSIECVPTSSPVVVRAAWWRRLGYFFIKRLPVRRSVTDDTNDQDHDYL